MPILNVKVSAPRSDELTQKIASTLAELTESVLGKRPDVLAMTIEYVDPRDWFGGRALARLPRARAAFTSTSR